MNQRLQYFDIAKGFAIITVILGHNAIPHEAMMFIFSFHMPLFFIVSGYFFKPLPVKDILRKGWRQLLVPYLFTAACIVGFFVLFQALQTILTGASIDVRLFTNLARETLFGAWPVWFLLALLVAKLALNFALRHELHALAIVLLAATVGYVWGNYVCLPMPLQIFPGMIASLFLYIGYTMRREGIMERIQVGGGEPTGPRRRGHGLLRHGDFRLRLLIPQRLVLRGDNHGHVGGGAALLQVAGGPSVCQAVRAGRTAPGVAGQALARHPLLPLH